MNTGQEPIPGPWLILCEGKGDRKILEQLIDIHSLGASYQVRAVHGKDKFAPMIQNLMVVPDFISNVKALAVVADNDDDSARAFKDIASALSAVGLPVPRSPEIVANDRLKKKATVVYMLPSQGVDGALETLCIEAAYSQWGIKAPIDSFVAGTDAKNWNATKQSKMRMQAIIAATCKCNPDTTLANLFDKHSNYHLNVAHSAFNGLVSFLRNFPSTVTV